MGNPQRSLEDRANWLGGIIDGEGMITAIKQVSRKGTHNYLPRISVVNTDMSIIDEVISIFKEMGLPHYVQTKAGKGTWKTKIEVIIQGQARCARTLPVLIPLIIAKRKRAVNLLGFCESRLTRGKAAPYSEHEWTLLEAVKSELRYPLIRSETTRQAPPTSVVMI